MLFYILNMSLFLTRSILKNGFRVLSLILENATDHFQCLLKTKILNLFLKVSFYFLRVVVSKNYSFYRVRKLKIK